MQLIYQTYVTSRVIYCVKIAGQVWNMESISKLFFYHGKISRIGQNRTSKFFTNNPLNTLWETWRSPLLTEKKVEPKWSQNGAKSGAVLAPLFSFSAAMHHIHGITCIIQRCISRKTVWWITMFAACTEHDSQTISKITCTCFNLNRHRPKNTTKAFLGSFRTPEYCLLSV